MDTHEQAGPEVANAEVVREKKCWFERAKRAVTGVRLSTVKTVLVAAVGVGIGILATEAYGFYRANTDKSTPEQE